MWAKLLQSILTSVVLPLLKDLAFMIFNALKVRQMRLKKEAEAKARAEAAAQGNANYENNPSDDSFGSSP